MRVRFSIISPGILAQVRPEVDSLSSAVDSGDMEAVDVATEALLALTADCVSIDLSEEEWHTFLNEIRRSHPAFESSYVLPGSMCVTLFPTVTTDDHVLELPIDDDAGEKDAGV